MKDQTCAERLESNLDGRMEDVRTLYDSYLSGDDNHEDLGSLFDYGLEFHSFRFDDGRFGYRWLLGTGGPADWFDFIISPHRQTEICYTFQDWFDCAETSVSMDDWDVLIGVLEAFVPEGAE